MFTKAVTVEGVIGDKVRIRFTKQKTCGCCRMFSLCGGNNETMTIDNPGLDIQKENLLEINIDEQKSYLAGIITFLLPSSIFIAGLIAFKDRGEMNSFLLSSLIVFAYFIIVKIGLRKYGKHFTIKINRKL